MLYRMVIFFIVPAAFHINGHPIGQRSDLPPVPTPTVAPTPRPVNILEDEYPVTLNGYEKVDPKDYVVA